MINPRELRIGNIVDLGVVIGIYQSTPDNYSIKVHGFSFPSEKISGEPITPEWLERLGFKKGWNGHDRVEFYKDGFRELADYGSQVIVIEKEGRKYLKCGYYENIIDLDYIHQLQNLYFALTGEELELKDKWRNGPGVEKWDFKD